MIDQYITQDLEYEQLVEAYNDCRIHKRNSYSQVEWEEKEEVNLSLLYRQLKSRKWKPGTSITFIVTRPKPREVFAACFQDRIVHHLLIRQIEYLFEKEFIEDNYNCRKGKGVIYGVNKLAEKLDLYSDHYTKKTYVGKFDFSGFFMGINKTILWERLEIFLREKYKKPNLEFILWLTKVLVFHCPEEDCVYHGDPGLVSLISPEKSLKYSGPNYGLPIGNLTSQIFANFYLHEFDLLASKHFSGGYGRYVDDFYVISGDKEKIKEFRKWAKDYLWNTLEVKLHQNKFYLQEAKHGIKFIGSVIKPGRIYTGSETISHFDEVIRIMNNNIGKLDLLETLVSRWNSYIGFMMHTNSYNIRRERFLEKLDKRWKKYVNIDKRYILHIRRRYKYKKLELFNGP